MVDRQRMWQYTGILTVIVTLLGVLSATLVSPAFRWQGNALSDLGVAATAAGTPLTVALFNGGLILGGLLGLVFAAYLIRQADQHLLGVFFALTVVLMGLVGVFPQDQSAHVPVASGFYLCITLTLWLDSGLRFREGWHLRGAVAALLGGINIGGLVVWGLTGAVSRPGIAIPEIVGALAFGTWAALVSLDSLPVSSTATNAGI